MGRTQITVLSVVLSLTLAIALLAYFQPWKRRAATDFPESAMQHAMKHLDANYTCPMHPQVSADKPGLCPICGMPLVKKVSDKPAAERRILYWHDPMKPEVHFDKPGKSPFMDMELAPVYADEGRQDSAMVQIDPRMAQSLGVRTAVVEKHAADRTITAVGLVQADENRVEVVNVRVEGYVERLYVRALSDPIKKGQVLMEIYSPELLAAQEEYLLVADGASDFGAGTVAAVRQRLALLGMSEGQIAALRERGSASRRVAVYAPRSGVVRAISVKQGMGVGIGQPAFEILDLSKIWVVAELPEAALARVKVGDAGEIRLSALPGQVFKSRIEYIYPALEEKSRTLKVRLSLPNPTGALKPQMLADVTFRAGETQPMLRVPSEAVIATGKRNVVIVAEDNAQFRPVEVEVGEEADGKTEILRGLEEGQKVVSSGQFLFDSESNIRGALRRLEVPESPAAAGEVSVEKRPAE